MAIYNNDGIVLNSIWDSKGELLSDAYDVNGQLIYTNEPTITEPIFSVMTYNIAVFTSRNTEEVIGNIVNMYNADLIGLQEVQKTTLSPIFNRVFSDYPYYSIGAQYNKDAIVSKYPLSDITKQIYDYNTLETKGYHKCYFEFQGKRICWFNTHLETTAGGVAKVTQAKQMHDLILNEEYFVVTGDFNTICKDVTHSNYIDIMKPFIDKGCHSMNCSPESGFIDTWSDGWDWVNYDCYPCDHIIISPTLKFTKTIFDKYKETVLTSQKLDHIPMYAEIALANN